MFSISTFLEKFKNITQPDETARRRLSEIIQKETGIKISIKNISIKNNIVHIKTKPLYKNEIYIKKGRILATTKESLVGKSIIDIR